MTLRWDFIIKALSELGQVSTELEKYQNITSKKLKENLSLRWTVERGLQAGLTLLFQVAEHILSQHFKKFPETYEDLLSELHTCGVLSSSLYKKVRGAGGFRNLLAHEYITIDLQRVLLWFRTLPSFSVPFQKKF